MALTIRSVFIIDPNKTIRLILSYPASTGRNTSEVLRVVDSLQLGDKHKVGFNLCRESRSILNVQVVTPINWQPGNKVIVKNGLPEAEAKSLFGDTIEAVTVSV
jgi:alkyl hydroperoxide reductase subunit AhpC